MLKDSSIRDSLIIIFQDKEILKIIQDLIDDHREDKEISEELMLDLEIIQNLEIIQCLINHIDTDEEIAEKTSIKLNIVRKILYKIYDSGIASYKRSKDPETQWFTYSWKFETQEVSKLIKEYAKENIKKIKEEIEEEENNMFFVCPYNHCRFDFEKATYYGFICPECGEEIKFQDNKEEIKHMKKNIEQWENLCQHSIE